MMNAVKLLYRAGKVFHAMRQHVTFSILTDGLFEFMRKMRRALIDERR